MAILIQRQRLSEDYDSDSDRDEEAPQVVVLKEGDLSAEEAESERIRLEKGKFCAAFGWSRFAFIHSTKSLCRVLLAPE